MGKLIVTYADGTTTEVPLDRERITIGRHSDNDIPLSDRAVSGHHAVIITILKDSFIEDLDSTNGTQINGKPIAKQPLSHGDIITIGHNKLRYESDASADEDDFEKTMVLKPGQALGGMIEEQLKKAEPAPPPAAPAATAAATPSGAAAGQTGPRTPPPAAAKPLLGRLRVASGPNQGKELQLTKALTTLGRPGVQVAAITRRADGYYIVHVGGQSGGTRRPVVNGREIDMRAVRLQHNDVIELAGTKMNFLLGPAP